jgi:hypothetical protein
MEILNDDVEIKKSKKYFCFFSCKKNLTNIIKIENLLKIIKKYV